jgi:hypothetical protein
MTAIVSAIYGKGRKDGHGCIIVADKMLSYRDIALETDSSKLHKLIESDLIRVVMGAAGTAELIEDFSQRLQENIERISGNRSKKEEIRTVRDIAKLSVKTINEMIKENVESLLIPYGKTLSEVFRQNVPSELLTFVGRTIEDNRKTLYRELEILISGVDSYGPHIFKIEEGDYVPTDSIGYDAVGSGFESANWTLMHQSYDPRKEMQNSLFMTAYAKINAEESLGVGTRTDGYIISENSIREIRDDEIDVLRSKINEMMTKEKDMKNLYISEFKKRYEGMDE